MRIILDGISKADGVRISKLFKKACIQIDIQSNRTLSTISIINDEDIPLAESVLKDNGITKDIQVSPWEKGVDLKYRRDLERLPNVRGKKGNYKNGLFENFKFNLGFQGRRIFRLIKLSVALTIMIGSASVFITHEFTINEVTRFQNYLENLLATSSSDFVESFHPAGWYYERTGPDVFGVTTELISYDFDDTYSFVFTCDTAGSIDMAFLIKYSNASSFEGGWPAEFRMIVDRENAMQTTLYLSQWNGSYIAYNGLGYMLPKTTAATFAIALASAKDEIDFGIASTGIFAIINGTNRISVSANAIGAGYFSEIIKTCDLTK
jgi:hypothetical protein